MQKTSNGTVRYLMCSPEHFGVEYVINPWMKGQIHATDAVLAQSQWAALRNHLARLGKVESMPARPQLPDLVFTANAALVYGGNALLSRFRYQERRPESAFYAEWLRGAGFAVHQTPEDVFFEGAGDALLDRAAPLVWMGHGMRSDLQAKVAIELHLGIEAQPLRLCDPRFYHLDTCFCPLEGGFLLYYSPAFDDEGNAAIESRIPDSRRIAVDDDDALHFACNAVNLGNQVVVNYASEGLKARLSAAGFQVTCTSLTEFLKAGGAAKCLSLRLDEAPSIGPA